LRPPKLEIAPSPQYLRRVIDRDADREAAASPSVTVIAWRLAPCGPCADERLPGRPRAGLRHRRNRCHGARLLRVGFNTVYRLNTPVIGRISRPGADPGHIRRTVTVARWLQSAGYPAVRAVDVDQRPSPDRNQHLADPRRPGLPDHHAGPDATRLRGRDSRVAAQLFQAAPAARPDASDGGA
jgi:hypothetical protein